jgi:DNA-binding transcriptional ArsR family regulator
LPQQSIPTAQLVSNSRALDAKIVDGSQLSLLSADRLKILASLGEEPKYPAQVARELKMQVQTVYYHVRLLSEAGLIRFVELEEKGGATAKKFASTASALAVVVDSNAWKPFASAKMAKPPAFLEPFVAGGSTDLKFVLGSPDPHGKYRARASELAAVELAMYLGNFATFTYPLYLLDTELKEKDKKANLVAVGGPKVNLLVSEINSHLPIQFEDKSFAIHSKLSGKTYEENVAVLEIVENPFNRTKKIMVVAGTNHSATRVAVLALLKERQRILEGNQFSPTTTANVLQGYDEDGDGVVDAVEVLE